MNTSILELKEFYEALDRLKKGKNVIIPDGYTINKRTVALEAQRDPSSIRNDRKKFDKLREDIEVSKAKFESSKNESKLKLEKLKIQRDEYKEKYRNVLARELMLIERINELEKELKKKPENLSGIKLTDLINKVNL